jgi:hypothetical protein
MISIAYAPPLTPIAMIAVGVGSSRRPARGSAKKMK